MPRSSSALLVVAAVATLATLLIVWPRDDGATEPAAAASPRPRAAIASRARERSVNATTDPGVPARQERDTLPDSAENDRAAATRVLDELDWLFKASAVEGVTAHVEADEIVIVAPAGKCDASMLRDLEDTLVSFQLDPGGSFRALRCGADGTRVTLR